MLLSNTTNKPNIPLDLNLSLEDAVSYLLTSIAIENISLSKLIEAETSNVLSVINKCKNSEFIIEDIIKANKSINANIKNIIELEKISQYKLENVKDLFSTVEEQIEDKRSLGISNKIQVKNNIKKASTSVKSLNTKKNIIQAEGDFVEKDTCSYSLIGTGHGSVTDCSDEFFCQAAVVYAFVLCQDICNRTICYSVQNYTDNISMHAAGYNIKIECPSASLKKIIIYGKGQAEKCSQCNIDCEGAVKFMLVVREEEKGEIEFKMEMKSEENAGLNHNSGYVRIKNSDSDLRFETCFSSEGQR